MQLNFHGISAESLKLVNGQHEERCVAVVYKKTSLKIAYLHDCDYFNCEFVEFIVFKYLLIAFC